MCHCSVVSSSIKAGTHFLFQSAVQLTMWHSLALPLAFRLVAIQQSVVISLTPAISRGLIIWLLYNRFIIHLNIFIIYLQYCAVAFYAWDVFLKSLHNLRSFLTSRIFLDLHLFILCTSS